MEEISDPIGVFLLGLVMTDAWRDIRLPLGHNSDDLLDNDWVGRLVAARKCITHDHRGARRGRARGKTWRSLRSFPSSPLLTSGLSSSSDGLVPSWRPLYAE